MFIFLKVKQFLVFAYLVVLCLALCIANELLHSLFAAPHDTLTYLIINSRNSKARLLIIRQQTQTKLWYWSLHDKCTASWCSPNLLNKLYLCYLLLSYNSNSEYAAARYSFVTIFCSLFPITLMAVKTHSPPSSLLRRNLKRRAEIANID